MKYKDIRNSMKYEDMINSIPCWIILSKANIVTHAINCKYKRVFMTRSNPPNDINVWDPFILE